MAFCLFIPVKKSQNSSSDLADARLSELKNWYNTEKAKSMGRSQIPLELTPVWDKMTILEDKENMIYEVEIVNPNHVFTADKKIDNTKYKEYEKRNSFRLVLIKDKKTSVVSGAYMNIVSGNDSQNIQNIHYKKAASFTGTIQYYNIDGSYNLGWHYTNGTIDKKFIARLRSASGAMTEKEPACGVFPVMGTICAGGDDDPPVCYTSVVGTFEIDCFPIEGGGSTGGGSTGGGNGGDGGGMGPGGSGSSNPSEPTRKDTVMNADFVKNAKAMCALKKLTQNNYFRAALNKFIGENKPIDLTFKLSDIPQEPGFQTMGNTIPNPANWSADNIDLTIAKNLIDNMSSLEVASTLIHEGIHAEIFRKLISINGPGQLNNMNFPSLFNLYTQYKANAAFNHEYIANFYVETIASTLKQYDNSKFSDDYYKALAWSGLKGTDAYKNLTDAEKNDIQTKKVAILANRNKNNCDDQ